MWELIISLNSLNRSFRYSILYSVLVILFRIFVQFLSITETVHLDREYSQWSMEDRPAKEQSPHFSNVLLVSTLWRQGLN